MSQFVAARDRGQVGTLDAGVNWALASLGIAHFVCFREKPGGFADS